MKVQYPKELQHLQHNGEIVWNIWTFPDFPRQLETFSRIKRAIPKGKFKYIFLQHQNSTIYLKLDIERELNESRGEQMSQFRMNSIRGSALGIQIVSEAWPSKSKQRRGFSKAERQHSDDRTATLAMRNQYSATVKIVDLVKGRPHCPLIDVSPV
jgi:hypothetical protein